jgi:hypothetical protein
MMIQAVAAQEAKVAKASLLSPPASGTVAQAVPATIDWASTVESWLPWIAAGVGILVLLAILTRRD